MTVTKQQQLEWMSKAHKEWPFILDYICMSGESVGDVSYAVGSHRIAKQEWQQELDKTQKKNDRSWHDRGELPPVGRECLSPGGEIVMIASHGSISGVPVAFYPFGVGGLYSAACAKQFRPLRTEREKAIDAACEVIGGVIGGRLIIERLYDAGLLK